MLAEHRCALRFSPCIRQKHVVLSSSEEPHPWLTEKYTQLLQWHNVWTAVTPAAVMPSSTA
jgi:hypothetical protein